MSDQLFSDPPPRPLLPFQIHSPTSKAAAVSMKPNAAALRERVFTAIANEPLGLTDLELEDVLKKKGSTLRPRRIELQRAKRIVSCGKRLTASGRYATIWKAR